MGKNDYELTQELFKMQMRQAKRLWTADWAESSIRHGEACMQSAQQHFEAQAMALAAYYQAEKLATQGIKLARDQDSRAFELTWRAEVREFIRDELGNQNNRFNIVMLCDTVCLGCVFSLVAEAGAPTETPSLMLNLYVLSMGVSIMLFTISLWCSIMVVRRLHEHTASILERKLFAQSADLQKVWHYQLEHNLPTGPREIQLFNAAYEKWIGECINPLGKLSIHLMSIGIVAMFITAGLLTHVRYMIEYDEPTAVYIFWSTVAITSGTIVFMKISEDRQEKRKIGVYDRSYQDEDAIASGPFAKILRASQQLFSEAAVNLGSEERMEALDAREHLEKEACTATRLLHQRVESLQQEAKKRGKLREQVLRLLTTASEELDALPEELTSSLNKLLHEINIADSRTAALVTIDEKDNVTLRGGSRSDWQRLNQIPRTRKPMSPNPIEAQRIPVNLGALRKKMGEISLTTLLRIRNMSDQSLRLKSGVQLKEGRYIKELKSIDSDSHAAIIYHLYPISEIPPRTEVVIAARSNGAWLPTSGIDGEIVYMSQDESWRFRISFSSGLIIHNRKCHVEALVASGSDRESSSAEDSSDANPNEVWHISREELDQKANSEFLITIDVHRGQAAQSLRKSSALVKSGYLMKNKSFGLRLQWKQKWVTLNSTEIIYCDDVESSKKNSISIKHIKSVKPSSDIVHAYVLEIELNNGNPDNVRFAASSPEDRDSWIHAISSFANLNLTNENEFITLSTGLSSASSRSWKGDIECVQLDDMETKVLSS